MSVPKLMAPGLVFAFALIAGTPVFAADDAGNERLTFTKDVLPILQENCQICHRPGGDGIAGMVAPMSLVEYREVRPWAKAVAKAVSAKVMPPWSATPETLGQFSNERYMSDADREIIVRWAESGAARGNPADAPEPIVFENKQGWGIGKPDLIVQMPEPYWVADDVRDIQPRVSFPITEEHISEPRWIQAIEIMPGSEGVHHAVASARAPEWGDHPAERFSAGSIAAGEDPIVYPEGFGNLLRPGTQISISMHYFKEVGPGTGFWDQTSIGFKFHEKDADIKYKVTRGGISARGWEIPPRQGDWLVGSSRVFNSDTVLISLHPHMHFRGHSMKYTAYYPDGTTETLLDVPQYDYAWQTQYHYKTPKFIPKGTRIDVMASYDNSETRKAEYPVLNIDRAIRFGSASTDEMMIPFVEWAEIDEADSPAFRAASLTASGTD